RRRPAFRCSCRVGDLMTCEDCNCFRAGDDVRIVTSGLVGRINSSDETGTYHEIWIYGSGGRMFGVPSWQIEHAVTEDPPAKEDLPTPDEDNVIDFTKARKLRADTKTKGVA